MPVNRVWTQEQDQTIIKMRWERKTWSDIAKALQLHRNTVIERGRRLNAVAPTPQQIKEMEQSNTETIKVSKDINRAPLAAGHPIFWQMLCPNDKFPYNF